MAKKKPQPVDGNDAADDILRTAIDHLDQGIVIIDATGIVQAFNNAHKSLLGLPDNVIGLGQPFSRVIDHLASIGAFGPGDPKKIAWEHVKKIKAGELTNEEMFLPNGTIVEVQRSTLPDGGMVAVTTDVTERHSAATALKASEERFRDFADIASDWFWEMDEDLRFSYFSDRHKQVLGIDLDTLLGKRRKDLSRESTNTDKWQAHLADLEAHRPFRDFRYEIKTGPNTSRYISLNGKPIFDGEGNFKGYRGVGHDVTEESAAQRALLESKSILEATLDATADGLLVVDIDRNILATNQRLRDMWDIPVKILKQNDGFALRDWIADQVKDKDAFVQRVEAHYTDTSMNSLDQLQMKDGRVFERFAQPQYLNGEIVGRVISIRDITAQVQAERALEETVSLLSATLNATADGVFAIDLNGRIVTYNEQVLKIWSLKKSELEKNPNQQLSAVIASRLADPKPFLREVDRIHDRPEIDHSMRLEHKDGRIIDRWSRPQYRDGEIVGRVLSFRDVTEQVQVANALETQKDLLEAVFKDVPDAIILTDTDRRITMTNTAVERIYGYTQDELYGKETSMLYESKDAFDRLGQLRFHLTAEQLSEPYIVNHRRKDGSLFPSEIIGSPMRDHDGNAFGFIGIVRDVSARIEAERKLQAALEMAEEANRTKSEFLANVSHDLRTPLNAILGFTEMMKLQVLGALGNDKYVEYVSDIQDSGHYLLDLVNDLLDISTIEAGTRQLEREHVDMAELVDECARTATGQDPGQVAKITTKVADGLPAVNADRRALKQIILNLLSNALRFTPKSGRITVNVKPRKKDIEIIIKDTGKGIPQSHLSRITAAFERGQAHPYSTADGTGLGLTIARALVEMHGGDLAISSQVGKGTSVAVRLPLDE